MEAPARGMLRRPVGLLPTVTARAVTAPEATGHMADAVVQAKDVAQERALAVPLQVWQPVASLPVAEGRLLSTVELAAQTVSQLVREAALPFALSVTRGKRGEADVAVGSNVGVRILY